MGESWFKLVYCAILYRISIASTSILLFVQFYIVLGNETKICNRSVTTASGSYAPLTICSGDLIFEDNFNFLDMQKWQHENTLAGGGNGEFQWYQNNRSNSFTKDGALNIRPTLLTSSEDDRWLYYGTLDVNGGAPSTKCTNAADNGCFRTGNAFNILNPIKSARVRTVNSFRFRYGRIEIRAKMPAGDWLWPAIWMLPSDNAYGNWPASGEIDLAEIRGNRDLYIDNVNIGVQQTIATLHYGPYYGLNDFFRALFPRNNANGYHNSFHKYLMEWTPDYIRFFIDDLQLGTVAPPPEGFWKYGQFATSAPGIENPWRFGTKMAPFDQEFYIIMNVAIGGTNYYFPDNAFNPDPKPWDDDSSTAMKDFWEARGDWLPTWRLNQNEGVNASLQVDYVRVWAL